MHRPNPSLSLQAVAWMDGCLRLLDQRRLPGRCEYLLLHEAGAVAEAIRVMVVRGAPAIGIAAAYAVVLAARVAYARAGSAWRAAIQSDCERLLASRPTAVNLGWAMERMRAAFPTEEGAPEAALLEEARAIHAEDVAANHRMGEIGAALLPPRARVITHCNAGALATGGYGTALGVIRSAYARGQLDLVYVGETRPWLQGARLTAWELVQDRIPVRLIADSAAAYLMRREAIHWVIVGADRIAANGDTANKIGTYALAVAARAHGVGFMVVAPTSTLDRTILNGASIPIEERPASELASLGEQPIAATGAEVWNPVFDVTPADLIDVIVTERGVIHRPDEAAIAAL